MEVSVPGVVTVVAVPRLPGTKPMPTEDMLRGIAAHLDHYRLITTEVYVAAPRYRLVEVNAEVVARASADSGLVQRKLHDQMLAFFHPLTGGSQGTGWDFGGPIYWSEIYRLILDTPGVARLRANQFQVFLDGQLVKGQDDIPIQPDEVVYSEEHKITVGYDNGTVGN